MLQRMIPARCSTRALALASFGVGGCAAATAQEFAAKTINLVVGFAPGGGYDTYARVLSRHFGRSLPGNPSVVVQNLPGGGSLNLVNVTYNTAPSDGSHIALVNSAAALEPVLGNAQARFETAKLLWIGNMNKDAVGCGAWQGSGIKTWADVEQRSAKFGGVGAAGTSSQHAYYLKHVLNVPITVITGFRGTNEINLAMQRGEVDMSCGLFASSVRGPFRTEYESGSLKMLIQFGRSNEPYFKDAVNVYSLLKTDDDRRVTDFIFGQAEISRPLMVHPATPVGIVTTLRAAFDKIMRDPAFLADAEKASLDILPMSGVDTAERFAAFANVPPELAERASHVLKP